MKRISLLFVAIFLSIALFSQDGGNLKSQFYFRVGASIPSWKYYGADGKSDWDNTKRIGGIFELGSIFMLNGIKLADGMRIGINIDYLSAGFQKFNYNSGDMKITNFFFGSKIGPSFSYSPVDKLVFDAYIKYNPVWVVGTAIDPPLSGDPSGDPDVFIGFVGQKLSVGMNVRYSILMMGFEVNPGSAKLHWTDTDAEDDDYLGNFADANDDGDRTKMPAFNITIGLSF